MYVVTSSAKASLVLKNGTIITMSRHKPKAQAVAIVNEKIAKVGTNDEVSPLIGPQTHVINLNGKTVIPGLIDTHIHVADFGKILSWLDLRHAKSILEVKEQIGRFVKKMPKEKWVIGHGLGNINLKASILDEVAPENPIILYHQKGRTCIVNSKALKMAGITKDAPSPQGGEIEKDPITGEPTGVLHENATDLVWKIVPQPTEKELMEYVESAFKKIVEAGLTTIHWIVTSTSELGLIANLLKREQLPLRIRLVVPINMQNHPVIDAVKKRGHPYIRLLGFIIFVDGSLSAQTAALSQPYTNMPTAGNLLQTEEKIRKLMSEVLENELQPIIHAMGDRAIDLALSAIQKFLERIHHDKFRPIIEQPAVLNPELINRMKNLKVTASIQPLCIITEFEAWSAIQRLGQERARWLYPLKTLISTGVRVCGGSDCPMEPLNPFAQIKASVTRPYFKEEQVTIEEALRMYTTNAAYTSFEENLIGTIEEGKLADLTVISHNPYEINPDFLDKIDVEITIVGGNVVYQKNTSVFA